MAEPKPQVVIFALIKDGKILLEKRPVKGFADHQYLIPGGAISVPEDLEQALKREVTEELGITPLQFAPLVSEEIVGLYGNLLKPFVVTKWEGDIPKIGLDKEDSYPLEWIEIDTAQNTQVASTKKIIAAVKVYLQNQALRHSNNDTDQT